jgi:hypothetical protein
MRAPWKRCSDSDSRSTQKSLRGLRAPVTLGVIGGDQIRSVNGAALFAAGTTLGPGGSTIYVQDDARRSARGGGERST